MAWLRILEGWISSVLKAWSFLGSGFCKHGYVCLGLSVFGGGGGGGGQVSSCFVGVSGRTL